MAWSPSRSAACVPRERVRRQIPTGGPASSTCRPTPATSTGATSSRGAKSRSPPWKRRASCSAQRGVGDGQINYLFADEAEHEGGAQAIADEAAAGAYDMVILSHGYFDDEVSEEESTPQEVAAAIQEIGEVSLVVC